MSFCIFLSTVGTVRLVHLKKKTGRDEVSVYHFSRVKKSVGYNGILIF